MGTMPSFTHLIIPLQKGAQNGPIPRKYPHFPPLASARVIRGVLYRVPITPIMGISGVSGGIRDPGDPDDPLLVPTPVITTPVIMRYTGR